MSGHALPFLPESAAAFVPATQAMCDHHFVPEGACSLDGGDIADREVEPAS